MNDSPITKTLTDAARAIKAANEQARKAAEYRRVLELILTDIDEDPDKVRGITIKTIQEIRKVLD